jgi:hypothetical protein
MVSVIDIPAYLYGPGSVFPAGFHLEARTAVTSSAIFLEIVRFPGSPTWHQSKKTGSIASENTRLRS